MIEIADTPRSYLVKTSEGAVYRRNRRHLHKDASQDQSMPYTDVERNAETKQPMSAEQEQHIQSSEDQQYPQSSEDQQINNKKQTILVTDIVHVQDDWSKYLIDIRNKLINIRFFCNITLI